MFYSPTTIKVAPGSGTFAAALLEAKKIIKAAPVTNPADVTLELTDGVYTIPETAVFDEGYAYGKLNITAAAGTKPVISGLTDLAADGFVKAEGKDYYVYRFPANADGKYPLLHDFYMNGKRVALASSPIYITKTDFADRDHPADRINAIGLYVDAQSLEVFEEIAFPTEYTIYVEWEFFKLHVTGVDYNDTTEVDGCKLVRLKLDEEELMAFSTGYNRSCLRITNRKYFYSNNKSLLTPGTYAYDSTKGELYYQPAEGDVVGTPAYSVVEQLVYMQGVKNVTFDGITFTGTGCIQPAVCGYMSGQANTESRFGTLRCAGLLFDNAENTVITNCVFTQLGSNGVQSINRMCGLKIENCRFDKVEMCAITLGNHNTKWEVNDSNYEFSICNNYVANIGMEYPTSPAIYISHIDGLKMNHNTILNVAYSGVSVGWGWSVVPYAYGEKINVRNAEIAYNRIEDYMQLTRDGAAIYVLGANCTAEYTPLFNTMHDNYARRVLDRSFFNPGYYMDGSSSNWYVFDNVISGSPYPIYTQFNVPSQYNHNIITERTYSTEEISQKNVAPERNVHMGENFIRDSLDAIYAEFPAAKAIAYAAGCDLAGGKLTD